MSLLQHILINVISGVITGCVTLCVGAFIVHPMAKKLLSHVQRTNDLLDTNTPGGLTDVVDAECPRCRYAQEMDRKHVHR